MLGNLELVRRNNFDAIRLVLAAMVIVSHSFALTDGNDSREPLLSTTHGQAKLGSIAVFGFFILSGYLGTHSWITTGRLGPYVGKRAYRIVPGFLVAALVGVLFIAPLASHMTYWHSTTAPDIAFALLRLGEPPGVAFPGLPYSAFNGSLWTIRFEVECYIVLAVLGITGLLLRAWVLGACVVASIGFSILPIGSHHSDPSYLQHLHRAASFSGYFFAGSFCYLWGSRIQVRWPLLVFAAAAGLASALLPPPLFLVVLPFCAAYLLLSVGLRSPAVLPKWFARFDLSYGTYLYGWFVSQTLLTIVGGSMSSWVLAAASVPVAMVVATPSWLFVERPFIRMKRSSRGRLTRRASVRAPAQPGRPATASEAVLSSSGRHEDWDRGDANTADGHVGPSVFDPADDRTRTNLVPNSADLERESAPSQRNPLDTD